MKKKYLAYVRVSTAKQGERGSSLVEQKSAIEAYAKRNELSVSDWFEEVETAAKQGRRMFAQMLGELRHGKADGLIIHKIDRSARNLRDWADLGDLIDRGIDVRFVSDNFDLLSRGGRLSADIQAVVAADYIRNLREEVKKGMYGRLKQGLYPWAAPLGYLNTGKGKAKTIDPIKGPLVREMFELYAGNTVAFEQLRHAMWQRGLRTSTGKPLYDDTLTRLLNNPFYAGVIRIRKTGETFQGAHQALISLALFQRVRLILRGKTVPKAKKHTFLLRQMLQCGNCTKRHLTGEYQKGAVYYRCHGVQCQGMSLSGKKVETNIVEQIMRLRMTDAEIGDLRDLVKDEYTSRDFDMARRKKSLALRLENLDARIGRLTDLVIDNVIDQDTFSGRKEGLLLERQGILGELNGDSSGLTLEQLLEKFELTNDKLLRYESMIDDEKRELFNTVGSNYLAHKKSLAIKLRTPFDEIVKEVDIEECAHHRGDVRTQRIFDVLKNIADSTSPKSSNIAIADQSRRGDLK